MHDIAIIDQLLQDIRKLGYNYEYYADITNRNHTSTEVLATILQYIGHFDDEGISAELVGVVGQKGNTDATETILDNYIKSSASNRHNQAVFYDNALWRIKDKRYISVYLDFLRKPEDASGMPLTMIMLGKWHINEAKPIFLNYLNGSDVSESNLAEKIIFISLEALSYYDDIDGEILKAFERKLDSNNKDIVTAAKKAIKRLMSRTKGCLRES